MQTIIVGGGILDAAFLKQRIEEMPSAVIIAADRGMNALAELSVTPDHLLGDYDSIDAGILREMHGTAAQVTTYPAEKDFTDTEAAIYKALEMGAHEICLLGMTGARLDHFLAVVQNLLIPYEHDVKAVIEDPGNRLFLVGERSGEWTARKEELFGRYISLVPITDHVDGVTFRGVKYPLEEASLTKGPALCISNEALDQDISLSVRQGVVCVILSAD